MANTFIYYTGDGSTDEFTFPFSYIDSDYVKVYLDDVALPSDGITYTVASSTVTIAPAPLDEVEILIKRVTPTGPLVDFVDGAVLTEADLDLVLTQSLHVASEAGDLATTALGLTPDSSNWDAETRKITNLSNGTATGEAVTRDFIDSDTLHKNGGSTYDAQTTRIVNVDTPIEDLDSANKKFVDDSVSYAEVYGAESPIPVTQTGDGVETDFTVNNVTHNHAYALLVTLDGITQQHTTNYTLTSAEDADATWSVIKFTTAPPDGVSINITNFGVQRGFTDYSIAATGTTILRPMADRLSEYHWNVLDFGAVGDGSTDDTTAIQDALTEAKDAGGGTVFMPKGTYKVTDTIYVGSKTTLYGTGYDSVIELNHVERGVYMGDAAADTVGCRLTNLRVKGADVIVGTPATGENAVRVHDNCEDAIIDNIWIEDVPQGGIKVHRINTALDPPEDTTGGVLIHNVHINGTGEQGITLVTFHRAVVSNCILQNISNHPNGNGNGVGLQVTNCRGVSISNCLVEVDEDGGQAFVIGSRTIDVDDDDQEAFGYQVSNCRFVTRGTEKNACELINNFHDAQITNCYFESADRRGMAITCTVLEEPPEDYTPKRINISNCSFRSLDTVTGHAGCRVNTADVLNFSNCYFYSAAWDDEPSLTFGTDYPPEDVNVNGCITDGAGFGVGLTGTGQKVRGLIHRGDLGEYQIEVASPASGDSCYANGTIYTGDDLMYAVLAKCSFTGTTPPVQADGSYNIDTVVRDDAGKYTITYEEELDFDYGVPMAFIKDSSQKLNCVFQTSSVTKAIIWVVSANGTYTDPDKIFFKVTG